MAHRIHRAERDVAFIPDQVEIRTVVQAGHRRDRQQAVEPNDVGAEEGLPEQAFSGEQIEEECGV
jgi:hypothetical protein